MLIYNLHVPDIKQNNNFIRILNKQFNTYIKHTDILASEVVQDS